MQSWKETGILPEYAHRRPDGACARARILAQVDTIITHKLTVQTDIDHVRRNLKSNLPAEVKYAGATFSFGELLRALDVGQALVSNTETDRAFLLTVRPRVSAHGGFATGR